MKMKKENSVGNKSRKLTGIIVATIVVAVIVAITASYYISNKQNEVKKQNVTLTETSIAKTNNEIFEEFVGINKSASEVGELLGRILVHNNNTNERQYYGAIEAIKGNSFTPEEDIFAPVDYSVNYDAPINYEIADVFSGSPLREIKYYTVAVTEYNTLGCISQITVWQQSEYFPE